MSEIMQETSPEIAAETPKRRGRKPGARLDRTNIQSLEALLRRAASQSEELAHTLKNAADVERMRQTNLIDTLTKAVLTQ